MSEKYPRVLRSSGWSLPCLLLACVALSTLIAGLPGKTHAALTVTVQDAEVSPGGAAYVDVLIRSDSSDVLDLYGILVSILLADGSVQFFNPPSDFHLFEAEYLFAGDSVNKLIGPPAGFIDSSSPGFNDIYIGGDGTDSGTGVLVPGVDTLLLRLEVTASLSAVVGSEFAVAIDDTSLDTFFFGVPLSGDTEPPPLTISGLLKVVEPSQAPVVVPEPASFSSMTVLFGMCAIGRCRGWWKFSRRGSHSSRIAAAAR